MGLPLLSLLLVCLPSALAWWRYDGGPRKCVRPAVILASGAEECYYLGWLLTLITTLCSPSKERHHPAPGQTWQHRSTDQTVCLQTVWETAKKTDGLERRVSQPYSSLPFVTRSCSPRKGWIIFFFLFDLYALFVGLMTVEFWNIVFVDKTEPLLTKQTFSTCENRPFQGLFFEVNCPFRVTKSWKRYLDYTNPVCARRVNLLVSSLPLHRHSYIGFIFTFHFIDS